MKIRGWTIDGFGVFHDYQVRDLPDGLTVFHGANEAGKTTLLAFLRGVLFGFPDRRSGVPRYPPLNGGRHGGCVVLDGPEGEYTVDRESGRRSAARVNLPSGRSGSVDDLHRLFGGADEQLFRSIFAFSLTELQAFETLTANGVRDRIFSAGIAGAGRSARQVVARLGERAKALYGRSQRARITTLVGELNAATAAVDAARRAAAGYEAQLARELEAQADIERLTRAMSEVRRERARDELLIQLWPTWRERSEAHAERDSLPPIDHFPADGEARLAALQLQINTAIQLVTALHRELEELGTRRAELERDGRPLAAAAAVADLGAQINVRRERLAALGTARAELARWEQEAQQGLAGLGAGWTEARFARLWDTPPRREEIRAWEERLGRAAAELADAGRQLAATEARLAEVRNERERIAASLAATPPPSVEELRQQEMAVRRLRANLSDLRAVEVNREMKERSIRDGERAVRALEAGAARYLAPTLAVAIVAVLTSGAGAAAWRETVQDRPAALVIAAAAALLALVFALFRQRAVKAEVQRRAQQAALVAEIEEATRARDAAREKAETLRGVIKGDSYTLGLPALPSYHIVEEGDDELTRQKTQRARWDDAQVRMAQLDAVRREIEEQVRLLVQRRDGAARTANEEERAWAQWKATRELPGELPPQGVVDFLGGAREVRAAVERRDQTRDDVARRSEEQLAWEKSARAVLERVGDTATAGCEGEALLARVRVMRETCEREAERQRGLADCEAEQQRLATRVAAAEEELARHTSERARLLGAAAATDESDFRRRLAAFRRRRELERVMEDCDRRLSTRMGRDQQPATVRAALAAGQVEEWERRLQQADSQLAVLERERDDALKRQYDAERGRRALEESSDVAALEAEREALRAELAAAAREWRVIALAQALIEETLREFERTRQPAVLAQASQTFAAITNGRYTRVLQDEHEEEVVVLDGDGRPKRPDELSRGTAEQLYLSIRLGLAAEFARRSGALPLIMDDVLVNFDPERARRVAAALGEFAGGHQVLFFTCQPATRDLLVGVAGAARVIEMPSREEE